MKAIIYARFSPRKKVYANDGREQQSESIETQLEYCRKYCQENGHEIVGEYSDREMSGDDAERPGLWEAIDSLKRDYVLVAYRPDRLARSVRLSELIRRDVEKRKASIEVTQGGTNGTDPEQVLMRQVLQAFAEYERKVTAIRTKYGMQRHQAQGRRMGSVPPYGWRIDHQSEPHRLSKLPSRMVEIPAEQAIIAKIVELHERGYTQTHITKCLVNLGMHPRGGGAWHPTQVWRIIKRAQSKA